MATARAQWTTRQPGKALWTAGAIAVSFPKMAFWMLFYLPRRTRQHPQWTYFQAVMNRFLRSYLYHASIVEVRTPLNLVPGAEKERFVTMKPSEKDIYRGVASRDSEIAPTTTGGTWYPSPYQPGDEQMVILHFHGGAYTIGDSRPHESASAANILVEQIGVKALLPTYRLASNPAGRFPAALQDAITAYQFLLDQGVSVQKILVGGDSAGGNLALALLRYLADHEDILPSPAAAVLWSPWVDVAAAYHPEPLQRNRNYSTDYIPTNFGEWGSRAYTAGSEELAQSPYISPRRHRFRTSARVWVHVGGAEMLYDEVVEFVAGMKKVDGNEVEIFVEPYANHDVLLSGPLTGFEAEAREAAKVAGHFVHGSA